MAVSSFVQICLMLLWSIISICLGDNMIGPGMWHVESVSQCEEEHPVAIAVSRRKMNRTHDGFTVEITSKEVIDDSYGMYVDICKQVDGGCKPYQVLADECLPRFVQKYAADNVREFFELAGLDPPEFPVPEGSFVVQDYVFDYSELPAEGIYGSFGAAAYVLRGDQRRACLALRLRFAEQDDDDR